MASPEDPERHASSDLKLGTRGSALALAQSRQVAARLEALGIAVELVVVRTSGDRLADVSLARVGGKGLFIKELEEALLAGEIDLAVHSMKDLPAEISSEFSLVAVPARAAVNDVLIRRADAERTAASVATASPIDTLPPGSRVGTGSLRRRAQIAARRTDVEVLGMRGNIDTRLRKLASGDFDAIVLAAAGLQRLGVAPEVDPLDPDSFLPAPGQGALALEARASDQRVAGLVAPLHDPVSAAACTAERAMLRELGASCVVPVAGWARLPDGESRDLVLDGLVASLDGGRILRERMSGARGDPALLGRRVARALIDAGAREILAEIERESSGS